MDLDLVAFSILAALMVYSAYRVVTTKIVTHAALFLAITFAGVGGIFLLLEAPFMAAVQVLIYAGAVMAVVIFAIFLSDVDEIHRVPQEIGERAVSVKRWFEELQSPYWGLVPLVLTAGIFVMLMILYRQIDWPADAAGPASEPVVDIGGVLFTDYVIPFELASIILLIAMVGAIVLTKREDEEE